MTKKWRPVELSNVEDIVAEDWWTYWRSGRKVTSHIAIGRPTPDPSGRDWYCPLLLEGRASGWKPIYGVGPVDAMMNALIVVSRLFHEFAPTPSGGKLRTRRTRRGSSKSS